MFNRSRLLVVFLPLLLAACGGSYDGSAGSTSASSTSGHPAQPGDSTPSSARTMDEHFTQNVQPNMDFCRTCHVPAGLADTDKGRDFMLSGNKAQDLANLRASWERLGMNNPTSRILLMASGQETPHSGGAPWPRDSAAYRNMDILLKCFADPNGCAALLGNSSTTTEPLSLLGSKHGGHYWFDYCADKGDDAVLPQDPRELVVPGVSEGKAVHMNAYWQTCQADDHPGTCGELRKRVARGYPLVASAGQVGAGSLFSGDAAQSNYTLPASDYNIMWQRIWQLSARPDNYDQLVAERWGMPLSPTRNPYPLAGEDPNKTHGGSGQLPMGLTQLRNADGSWTGKLNVTCSICHGGGVGTPADGPGLGAMYGTNSLSDITLMFTDLGMIAPQQSALAVISQNKVRGTGNITNFQLFGLLVLSDLVTHPDQLASYMSIQNQPSTGTEDPPVWWNVGHRSGKFFDGGMVMDAKRIELSFHFPNAPVHQDMAADQKWITDHQQDGDAWIMSLRAPVWPESRLGSIDKALAEQGAILFHSKNLWADNLHNPVLKPEGGNGSCASCHGAYSPRFVNDPAYLSTPLLEGVAANITPIEVIGTDSRRLDGNSQTVSEAARNSWFAYSDTKKNAAGVSLCGDQNDKALRGDRKLGYLAPPLYGVWATAPYLHNGSVPNLWEVLKPSERKPIWTRQSKMARADQVGKVVMGYDDSLSTGYDREHMGWKYQALACGGGGTTPYLDCTPNDAAGVTMQDVLNPVYGNGGLLWNLANMPVVGSSQIEQRKIYNTRMYSQGNKGHEFTAVLTDAERRALLEYLKTL